MQLSTKLRLGYLATGALDTWLAGMVEAPGRSGARGRRARLVTKPLLMPLLAGALASDRRAVSSPLRTSTLVAQGFGWGGDVALLGQGTASFALGAGSFGIGHAAYISGFLRSRDRSRALLRTPTGRVALGVWAIAGPVMALAAARQERVLGPAVAAYAGLLAGTFATGSRLDPALPVDALRLSAWGAGLFLASDTVLSTRKFLLRAPSPRLDAALERTVMASYTAAQLLLAEGAARAARA